MPDMKIGTIETVHTHPSTRQNFVWILNQDLIFRDRIHSSIFTPNQMKAHRVIVSDVPKEFDRSSAHTIIATVDDRGDKVTLSLRLGGGVILLRYWTH